MNNDFANGKRQPLTRREFVKLSAAAGVGLGMGTAWGAETKNDMPYRPLGRTGEKVSVIGLGGYHIGLPNQEEAESIRLIRTAMDGGINFLDNCWDYNAGVSEARMGKALLDGYRAKAFLMTKIDGRTKAAANQQIDESLKRLQTDHVDLLQFHEIIRLDDADAVFKSGAMEAVLAAKKAGKVRFIGFTGHKDPEMHLKMLSVAAEHQFRFDAVQMPLNVMDAHYNSFEKRVLPALVKDGIGVLGMKSLGFGDILRSQTATAMECLHYALNLPTSTVITGMETAERLDQALTAARTYQTLTPEKITALLARTADAAKDGKYEEFKTKTRFDGTSQHPEWLG